MGIFNAINDLLFGAPPDAPDYQSLANQQTWATRPNQNNPFSFVNWSQDDKGKWSQQAGFSEPIQNLFNLAVNRAGQGMSQPIGTGDDAFRQAQQASWANAQANLLPQLQSHFDQGRSALANQGIDVGNGAAYGAAMQDLNRDFSAGLTGAWGESMQQGLNAQGLTYQQNRDAQNLPFSFLGQMQSWMNPLGFQTGGNLQQAGAQQFSADMQNYGAAMDNITGIINGATQVAGAASGKPPTPTTKPAGNAPPGVAPIYP